MKKRIASLFLALTLCLTLLPATALAAEEATVYVGGTALTGSKDKPVYATTADGAIGPLKSTGCLGQRLT